MNKDIRDRNKKRGRKFWDVMLIVVLFAVITTTIYQDKIFPKDKAEEATLYEITKAIEKESKKEKPSLVTIEETSIGKVFITIGKDKKEKKYEINVNPRESNLTDILKTYNVEYKYVVPFDGLSFFFSLLFYVFLGLLIWVFVVPMLKSGSFGSKAGKKLTEIPQITFDDIGGLADETLKEIMQTQELIKNPERAKKLGIKPSKGMILYGPSGTGKTLIAKAVANSFKAEFIFTNGADFVELFAGMGAKKVRDMFEKAKKNSPSVIFIDEIDAVGKKRSNNSVSSGNDEREQTLNQILVCLDGVEELKDVFVIAATNRIDILDDALLRPGRFDYKIKVDLPNVEGRKEIIRIHTKKKPLSEEVTNRLDEIADSTVGCSGADLESLFDNAAYHAFGAGRDEITMDDVNFGLDRMIVGSASSPIRDKETKHRVAYHEAGHAVVGSLLTPNSVRKATIVPRGQALGYVAQIPKEGLHDITSLSNMLKVMVAGGIAETLIYSTHSSGVSDDFKRAKELIGRMVEDWGMGSSPLIPSFSEKEKHVEMKTLYEKIILETTQLIEDNRLLFEGVATLLISKETIDGKEIEEMKVSINNGTYSTESFQQIKQDEPLEEIKD